MLHADLALVKDHVVQPGQESVTKQVAAIRLGLARWMLIASGIDIGIPPHAIAEEMGIKVNFSGLVKPTSV